MQRRLADALRWIAYLGSIALVATACSGSDGAADSEGMVTVFGPWRGDTANDFRAVLDEFTELTGIDVRYTGTGSFADHLQERIAAGNAPDIGIFPQPGLLEDLSSRGFVVPLPSDVGAVTRGSYYPVIGDVLAQTALDEGVLYRLNVKSLVWYPPSEFAEQNYEIPSTWGELRSLADEMEIDGYAPWCLGVESFGASGWPGTDWIEDIVLRFAGTDVYDAWANGEVAFTDEPIRNAFSEFASVALEGEAAIGGRPGVLNTSAQSAQAPMFETPPRCMMHRQASFNIENLPSDTVVGPDGDTDVFLLAGIDDSRAPLLIGGVFAGAMADRPEVWALMEFLGTPEGWFEAAGAISPNRGVGREDYTSAFDARILEMLLEAPTLRFDASDLMYPPVGTRSFFDAVTQYIGTGRLDDALLLAQSGYDADGG